MTIIARGYLSRARGYARSEFAFTRAEKRAREFTAALHLPRSSQIKLDLMLFRFSCEIVKRAANRSTTNGTLLPFSRTVLAESDAAIFVASTYYRIEQYVFIHS